LSVKTPVELRREGDQIDVLIGGRPFTTYYVDPAVATPLCFANIASA
jgi:hypothetical protein